MITEFADAIHQSAIESVNVAITEHAARPLSSLPQGESMARKSLESVHQLVTKPNIDFQSLKSARAQLIIMIAYALKMIFVIDRLMTRNVRGSA